MHINIVCKFRYQVLCHRKELLVPTPRLKKGLFNRLKNSGENKKDLRSLASRKGIDSLSIPVSLDERISIDLVVLGSVAVDKLGHRIGKGEGFADLEFALAVSQQLRLDGLESLQNCWRGTWGITRVTAAHLPRLK